MSSVLLFSCGMDSWIVDKMYHPDVKLFFNIGTKNNQAEFNIIKRRNDVTVVDLPLAQYEQADHNYFLPLRNLHFVNIAAHYGDTILTGTEGLAFHHDSSKKFAQMSEELLNYLLEEDKTRTEKIKIVMPFANKDKTTILREFVQAGGNLEECYTQSTSCYLPTDTGEECLNCSSCWSKFTAFYNNGYKFSDEQVSKFVNNVLSSTNATSESIELANRLKAQQ